MTDKLAAGLPAPDNEQEEQEIQAVAKLIVKAMLNAAKADGHIDESEMKRITGNLEKDGIRGQERELLAAELRKPLDTDSLVRAVPSPQVAAQVYAASLLAVDLDTDAEKQYLADLARRLALDANVVRHLHGAVGAAGDRRAELEQGGVFAVDYRSLLLKGRKQCLSKPLARHY